MGRGTRGYVDGMDMGGKRRRTSEDVMISAFQSIRGKILTRSFGFSSMVSWTSSASLGCRGKDWLDVLQAFTAQVKKLRVRIFIVVIVAVKKARRNRGVVWLNFYFGGAQSLAGIW
jgi:hypothetical protein